MTDDEDNGILWVGCDNANCCHWFHRDCLPTSVHAEVDLSLLINSDWFCPICANSTQSTSISVSVSSLNESNEPSSSSFCELGVSQSCQSPESSHQCELPTSESDLICQVCMCDQSEVSLEERSIFWATCEDYECLKSFHQMCLPLPVYRAFEKAKHVGSKWICGQCRDSFVTQCTLLD